MTAQYFLKLNCVKDCNCRFDVLEVILEEPGIQHYNHIEDAFGEGGM